MQWFKVADGGNPNGTAKDRVGLTAGTTYLAKYWNDNFFNIFNFVIGQGYSLIDDNLEQFVKASKGKYNPAYTYNTSSIATQTVNDVVLGSDGIYYEAQANAVVGDDPVGSITGNWAVSPLDLNAATVSYVDNKPTGQKNLLINGRKLIQQRGVTGGRKQVVLNTANLGGVHTISFTGTATVTIKEATTLAASDALTVWDAPLVTGTTSGTTVALTAGKYVHVEFSTTDFDSAQLEIGSIATNFEHLHNELELCLPFYQYFSTFNGCLISTSINIRSVNVIFFTPMRITPTIIQSWSTGTVSASSISIYGFKSRSDVGNTTSVADLVEAKVNAEIFNTDDGVGINYKEDRWYV